MWPAITENKHKYYEYILCDVDDILCMSVNAKGVMEQIQNKFKFKKDNIAEPNSYLRAKLQKKQISGLDIDSMWTISSYDYIKAAVKTVEETIEKKRWKLPSKADTPMASNYEPELDGSPELNKEDHCYYQELIGVLRWATELGRVDILLKLSLLSQYQACPCDGHMEQLLRIFPF